MLYSTRLWVAFVVTLCLAVSCHRSETYHGIEIIGSEKFAKQIHEALEIVRINSPDDLALIVEHIRRITESDRSGMDTIRMTCELAPATTYYSVTWCAGCIAHEAHHSRLSKEASYSYGHAEEERACIDYQSSVLARIGAPTSELEYLTTLDGGHFDADGDGEYSWEDYKARNW